MYYKIYWYALKTEVKKKTKQNPTLWILSYWELCQASFLYNRAIYFSEFDLGAYKSFIWVGVLELR